MTRIRIRCRPPAPTKTIGGTLVRFADLRDVEVFTVDHNGIETSIGANVESVAFTIGGNDPARATLTFLNPELDVEGLVDAAPGHDSDAERALADVWDARLLTDFSRELTAADVQRIRDMNPAERAIRVAAANAERARVWSSE